MTNSSASKAHIACGIVFALLSGCALAPVGETAGRTPPAPLRILSLSPDKGAPQAAEISSIRWTAEAQGGVKERTYTFWRSDGKEEVQVQRGRSAIWEWSPRRTGTYRVKVVVTDALGNRAESGWSAAYEIGSALSQKSPIALMPLQNLAATGAPLKEMMDSLKRTFAARDFNVLSEDALEQFLERHRVRYVGGMTRELGKAFLDETGTKAVLFLSVEHYDEADPPKIALGARLVSTGPRTRILWADDVALAGNDSPGLLGLGLVHDPLLLWNKAKEGLVGSLQKYLSGERTRDGRDWGAGGSPGISRRHRPKDFFRAPQQRGVGGEPTRVAVLPFSDESTRRNAGEIMTLHFVRALSEQGRFEVVEPGVVRQALLMSRTIMEGGLSLPQADLLRVMLDVDLVFLGNVFEYGDFSGWQGNPNVNFSTLAYDTKTRRVEWSSISYNRGDDGVFFFDAGRVNIAHSLASRMARALVGLMAGRDADGGQEQGP